jgi:hypothetical protein
MQGRLVEESMAKKKSAGSEQCGLGRDRPDAATPVSRSEQVASYILTGIIVPLVSFVLVAEYSSLKAFDGVKWDEAKRSEVRAADGSQRKTEVMSIYKFGDKPLEDVTVSFTFEHPEDYELESASMQVYERSFLNLFHSPRRYAAGGSMFTEKGVAYSFRMDELPSDRVYELTLHVKSVSGAPLSRYAALELRGKEGRALGDKGLSLTDYFRLYLGVFVFGAVVILLAIGLGVWWGTRVVMRRARRVGRVVA